MLNSSYSRYFSFFSILKQLEFETRAKICKNKVGKKLFEIMALKKTNLCVAVDFHSFDQLIKVNFF